MKIGKKLIISMLALMVGTMLLVYAGLYAIVADLRANIQKRKVCTHRIPIRSGSWRTCRWK